MCVCVWVLVCVCVCVCVCTYEKGVLNVVLISASQRNKVRGTERSCIMKAHFVLLLRAPCRSMRNGDIGPFILNLGQ